MNINYGVKLWSTNVDYIEDAKKILIKKIFYYIELTPIPNTKIDPFLDLSIPCIIHVTTENHGLNIADLLKMEKNLDLINTCTLWADELKAKYLVLHSGYGNLENALEFLDQIHDKRILIENMPKIGINNESMIGYNSYQIKELLGNRFSLCLDLNHAVKAAASLNIPYVALIEDFLKLNPKLFHIADGRVTYEKDEHLNFGNGNYNLELIMNLVKKYSEKNNVYMTLETPKKSIEDDIRNLEIIKRYY